MTLPASGAISLADLRTEYVGGSSSISLGDLYRGGANIKAKEGDNPATNLAASVPTSGAINISDFHGTAKGFKATVGSSTTNVDINTLFGGDYDTNYPKVVDINSGVTIGGSGDDAIDIPSGLAGGLTINNAGSILGFGGAANGGAGGNAISNSASGVTINNTGLVAGGGGGGGLGGVGGNGTTTSTTTETRAGGAGQSGGSYYPINSWLWTSANWSGIGTFSYGGGSTGPVSFGGHSFSRGSYFGSFGEASMWRIVKTSTVTTSTTGGSGGSSGRGQGYNISRTLGQAGAAGGTNAGTGGSGGNGGVYGQAGGSGSSGANGNSTNGLAGASGGAAGAAVTGTSVTMNNSGTLYGAVA